MVLEFLLLHRLKIRSVARFLVYVTALEATQGGQMDGFFSRLPFRCHLEEVASVGDRLKICPQLDSRVERCVRLPPALAVRLNRLFHKVEISNIWYKYGRIDGRALRSPGSGTVNLRSRNGPSGQNVRVDRGANAGSEAMRTLQGSEGTLSVHSGMAGILVPIPLVPRSWGKEFQ